MIIFLIFAAVLFLSYTNGANDNFKGVATLYGSKTVSFKTAITWSSVFTFLGALCSILIAEMLIKNFSGKGLVPDDIVNSQNFVLSVSLAAGATVMLATLLGMPISTTHGLTGALLGAGLMAVGTDVNFAKLGKAFVLPLVLSPIAAAVISYIVYSLFTKIRSSLKIETNSCACITKQELIPSSVLTNNLNSATSSSDNFQGTSTTSLVIDTVENCSYNGTIIGISSQRVVDVGHYFSSAAVCFARGMNDAPKIAGMLLILHLPDIRIGILAIAVAMIIGGLINSKKVAETMSKKITQLNTGQGFSANLVTSFMVILANIFGWPVSTTHVSVGTIYGIGMKTGKRNNKVIFEILLSWVLTLPIASIIGALVYFTLKHFN